MSAPPRTSTAARSRSVAARFGVARADAPRSRERQRSLRIIFGACVVGFRLPRLSVFGVTRKDPAASGGVQYQSSADAATRDANDRYPLECAAKNQNQRSRHGQRHGRTKPSCTATSTTFPLQHAEPSRSSRSRSTARFCAGTRRHSWPRIHDEEVPDAQGAVGVEPRQVAAAREAARRVWFGRRGARARGRELQARQRGRGARRRRRGRAPVLHARHPVDDGRDGETGLQKHRRQAVEARRRTPQTKVTGPQTHQGRGPPVQVPLRPRLRRGPGRRAHARPLVHDGRLREGGRGSGGAGAPRRPL